MVSIARIFVKQKLAKQIKHHRNHWNSLEQYYQIGPNNKIDQPFPKITSHQTRTS